MIAYLWHRIINISRRLIYSCNYFVFLDVSQSARKAWIITFIIYLRYHQVVSKAGCPTPLFPKPPSATGNNSFSRSAKLWSDSDFFLTFPAVEWYTKLYNALLLYQFYFYLSLLVFSPLLRCTGLFVQYGDTSCSELPQWKQIVKNRKEGKYKIWIKICAVNKF